jgi:hypothetical protein
LLERDDRFDFLTTPKYMYLTNGQYAKIKSRNSLRLPSSFWGVDIRQGKLWPMKILWNVRQRRKDAIKDQVFHGFDFDMK